MKQFIAYPISIVLNHLDEGRHSVRISKEIHQKPIALSNSVFAVIAPTRDEAKKQLFIEVQQFIDLVIIPVHPSIKKGDFELRYNATEILNTDGNGKVRLNQHTVSLETF